MDEQNRQPNTEGLAPIGTKTAYSRNYFTFIFIIVLLLLAGYWYYQSTKKENRTELDLSPSEVEQLGGSEQQRVLKAQLVDLESRATKLTDDSTRSDRFVIYIQMAEVQSSLGMNEEALESLNKIKDENKGNTRLWMTYGQVYRNMNNLHEARVNTRRALEIDSELVDNWLFLLSLLDDPNVVDPDGIFKEALTATNNDPEITAAYQAWQSSQQ